MILMYDNQVIIRKYDYYEIVMYTRKAFITDV